ncbi:ABC transporter substrate-binding protein [Meiothermus hypogaeus NBRC 106114]|uniref:ABC transporter substrate-binding protein n=3 Tax=Meiothermus hypogaeus TaxID=884155 RepID=A0A511R6J3_9DEIN|nr:NPCBM-associated, NEW3 domain of alpha-galactosidase [Meiothermus hypogaeus]GEM84626.1 ABC transporter substrate-binding protein [Meiothermus hypogaeus NBRC 106114]
MPRLIALMLLLTSLGLAQGYRGLALYTPYPSQSVRVGETINLPITLKGYSLPPQTVQVRLTESAQGWKASLLGGGRVVSAVYVLPDGEQSLSLRLEPPQNVRPGTYRFRLLAEGSGVRAELPIALTLGQVLPKRLSLESELPVLKGTPTASFRYRVILKNESDQDLLTNLEAEAPENFRVSFSTAFGGQEVNSLPLKAGETKDLDVQVTPPRQVEAKVYAVTLRALAGEAKAELVVNLDITGQTELSLTTPEGRLSGRAYAGRENPIKLVVKNTGSAPAENLEFSASEPSGWEVKFEPDKIEKLAPGGESEVTAKIKPSPRAVAGDYMLTLRTSAGSAQASADYRVTVQTSTLWGLVGVALIAVAVGAVGFAVSRFGRR